MHVVALTHLGTPVEQEAMALAKDLGTHAYDERLKLVAGLPALAAAMPDAGRAQDLAQTLRGRGHRALVCAISEVATATEMCSLRRFRFDAQALLADDRPEERLPWDQISALVRAVDRRRKDTVATVKDKSFDLSRAIMSGGLILSKTTKREVTSSVDDSEQLLYVFRRDGSPPWLLGEQGTHFGGLGTLIAHSTITNFAITVEQLRIRAPQARYDDRLLERRGLHRMERKPSSIPSAHDLELMAHLVALTITAG